MSERQNRAGDMVVTVRHPRTDFPQQGWIRKATVKGTVNDFYEANVGFGWFSQTQSYRMPDREIRKTRSVLRPYYQTEPQLGPLFKAIGTYDTRFEFNKAYGWYPQTQVFIVPERASTRRRSQIRPYYQTEPQQGWLDKPIVNGTVNDFYNASTGFGFFPQTQYPRVDPPARQHPRNLVQWRARSKGFAVSAEETIGIHPGLLDWTNKQTMTPKRKNINWRPTEPQGQPLNPNTFDLDRRWPAIAEKNIPRPVPGKKWYTSDPMQFGWVYTNLPAVFDPSLYDWFVHGDMTKPQKNKWRPTEPAQSTWLEPNQYDTDIRWPAIAEKNIPRPVPGKKWYSSDPQQFDWLYQNVLVDPSLYDWHIKHYRQPGIKFRTSDPPQLSWLFQDPLLDPALFNWKIDSQRVPGIKYRTSDPVQFDWLYQNVLVDPTLFTWTIDSTRPANKPQRPSETNVDNAWIFNIVPTYVDLFVPEFWSAITQLQGVRTPQQKSLDVRLHQYTMDMSWLTDVLGLVDGITVDEYLFYYHYRRHRSLDAIAKKSRRRPRHC